MHGDFTPFTLVSLSWGVGEGARASHIHRDTIRHPHGHAQHALW